MATEELRRQNEAAETAAAAVTMAAMTTATTTGRHLTEDDKQGLRRQLTDKVNKVRTLMQFITLLLNAFQVFIDTLLYKEISAFKVLDMFK